MSENRIRLGKIKQKYFFSSPEYLTDKEANHHVHIVGASGYGKTVLLSHIINYQIRSGRGLLYIDLKGDLETVTKLKRSALLSGREKDVKIFSISDQSVSSSYNLIGEGSYTQIRDRIMQSLIWSEEYYKNVSSSFLLKLVSVLCFVRDKNSKIFDLKTILDIIEDNEVLLKLADLIPDSFHEMHKNLESCYEFLRQPDNVKSLQGLKAQLESIVLSEFGSLIRANDDSINLFDAVRSGKLIFIFLDTRRYGETAKAVGRFVLQDLKATSAKIDSELMANERNEFKVVIDEFADLAQEDFIGFLDRARSSKMSIIVAHQEICDLLRISPEFAGRLMGNTSTLYAFLQKRPESAEMISSMAGTRKAWKETVQSQKLFFIDIPTGGKSLREVEEFNIHPNVIKSLTVGKCVVVKKYPHSRAYLVAVASESRI